MAKSAKTGFRFVSGEEELLLKIQFLPPVCEQFQLFWFVLVPIRQEESNAALFIDAYLYHKTEERSEAQNRIPFLCSERARMVYSHIGRGKEGGHHFGIGSSIQSTVNGPYCQEDIPSTQAIPD